MTTVAPASRAERATERSPAYDRARDASDRAVAERPELVRESFFTFAGHPVRMRVVGAELAAHLSAPFAHLRAAPSTDAALGLRIDVWDERACHVPYPVDGDRDATEIAWPSGNGLLAISRAGRYVRYDCSSWVTWLDRTERRVIGWRANAARLSMHERTRPLPFLLPLWYADVGVQVIHAGLVARGTTGVLLCGSNGAGKSTSSLAALTGGLNFLSDDHVGIEERRDGAFVGHSVFGSTRLEPGHLLNFPTLLPLAIESSDLVETKSLIHVAEAMPARMRATAPIRAIALPTVVDARETRVRPASRAEALRALAPSTLMQMPFGATKDRFGALARLVASAPVFRLELGRDINGIAPCVAELIEQLG